METISNLKKYEKFINLDLFIDFLVSEEILSPEKYETIWNQNSDALKFLEISEIIDNENQEKVAKVFEYLKAKFPNAERQCEDERNFNISSVRGGFPRLPPNYISRVDQTDEVKSNILKLDKNGSRMLVIYGMLGYGKSSLVAEALNDIIVRKKFGNQLFWINLGEFRNKDNIVPALRRFSETLHKILNKENAHCHDNAQSLNELITELFLDKRLKDALVILDNVRNTNVLKIFDFQCKTVITSRNKKDLLVCDESCLFVEVKTGFSKEESLKLFKKSLDVTGDLPQLAENIHEITQGHPTLISLVGSYLMENAEEGRSRNPQIWNYIISMFKKGVYRLNEFDNIDITKHIELCIDELLPQELRSKFLDLAIFPQDVNIPPSVLEMLWNLPSDSLRNLMEKFAKKSLIRRFYHTDLQTYIYGIHIIFLNYTTKMNKDIKNLHEKYILACERITEGDFSKLPDNNYNFQYLEYHLFNAEMFDRFECYFSLKFLEAKIKAVGKRDVIRDMDKYKIFITKNQKLKVCDFEDIRCFVEWCGGNLYNDDKTDIIHYALQQNKNSFVFKHGYKLAERSNFLYFKLQKPDGKLDYADKITLKPNVTYACFVDSPQHILIGTEAGEIKLFYDNNNKEISTFVGHSDRITRLIVSPCRTYFLSVSLDKTVFLWKFSQTNSARNSLDLSDEALVSPKTKQAHWQNMFDLQHGKIMPKMKFELPADDFFISAAFCNNFPNKPRIVTGSRRGNVIIWDTNTGKQLPCKVEARGIETPCVTLQDCDNFYCLWYGNDDNVYHYQFWESPPLVDMLEYDYGDSKCIALHLDNRQSLVVVREQEVSLKKKIGEKNVLEREKFGPERRILCSTLTSDRMYLSVGLSDGTVLVWDLEEEKLITNFKIDSPPKYLDTFYDAEKSVHILLVGTVSNILQLCQLSPCVKHNLSTENTIKDINWRKNRPFSAIVSPHNEIEILNGYNSLLKTAPFKSKIIKICFSLCGNVVTFASEDGSIDQLYIRNKKCTRLDSLEPNQRVTHLRSYLFDNSVSLSLSSWSSSDSFDSNSYNAGITVAIVNDQSIKIYDKHSYKIPMDFHRPWIFFKGNYMIIFDSRCNIFVWDLILCCECQTKSVFLKKTEALTANFDPCKLQLAIVCAQATGKLLTVFSLNLPCNSQNFNLNQVFQEDLGQEMVTKSCCFSRDGNLLAIGYESGHIKVWDFSALPRCQTTVLKLHNVPVRQLFFSPAMHILVSLGDEIAWWNLGSFKNSRTLLKIESLEIVELTRDDMSRTMDLQFWSQKSTGQTRTKFEYLLSCLKLDAKAMYVSSSKDFSAFLAIDEKLKVYVMEVVPPESFEIT